MKKFEKPNSKKVLEKKSGSKEKAVLVPNVLNFEDL